jgi:hypothetical protein
VFISRKLTVESLQLFLKYFPIQKSTINTR